MHLFLICKCFYLFNTTALIELLKQPDIDVNITDNKYYAYQTPLILTTTHGNIDAVKALLKHPDIDVNIQDNNGNTPLIMALKKHDLDIINELLKRNDVNLNLEDNDGKDFFDYLE
jgi:ankyrin repeat protein